MRSILISALTVTLSACAVLPLGGPHFSGGQKVTQPGVSFVTPPHKSWFLVFNSPFQFAIRAKGEHPNETWIVMVVTNQISTFSSPQDFLTFIKSIRSDEPRTGQFEIIKNEEQLYPERSETCVKHEMESKDYLAKRGGDYTIIQYFGMNCIHPKNPRISISIELSRKAPPSIEDPQFKTLGLQLLKSVEFISYR